MIDEEPKTERLLLPLSTTQLRAIDEWRRQQEDLPGRSEAVRRMIDAALKKGTKR